MVEYYRVGQAPTALVTVQMKAKLDNDTYSYPAQLFLLNQIKVYFAFLVSLFLYTMLKNINNLRVRNIYASFIFIFLTF